MTTTTARWLLLLTVWGGTSLWPRTVSGTRIEAEGRRFGNWVNPGEENKCKGWSIELLLLYDLSGSYADDVAMLAHLAPEIFESVENRFVNAKFALATFSDKPHMLKDPFPDACFKVHIPMTTNHAAIVAKIKTLVEQPSSTYPEAQLDGLFHGAKSRTVEWSDDSHDSTGHPILRVIVMATDYDYHVAGDANRRVPNTYIEHDGRPEPECGHLDYPTLGQVKGAFEERQVLPLFLVGDPEIVLNYRSLIDTLGQGGSAEVMDTDSANIVDVMSMGLRKICKTSLPTVLPTVTTTVTSTLTTTLTTTSTTTLTTKAATTKAATTKAATTKVATTKAATTKAATTKVAAGAATSTTTEWKMGATEVATAAAAATSTTSTTTTTEEKKGVVWVVALAVGALLLVVVVVGIGVASTPAAPVEIDAEFDEVDAEEEEPDKDVYISTQEAEYH